MSGSRGPTDRGRRPCAAASVIASLLAVVGMAVLLAAPAEAQSGGSPGRIRHSWIDPFGADAVWVGWTPSAPAAESYTVTAHPSGATCVSTGTRCRIDGLTEEVRHEFVIESTNAHGSREDWVPSLFIPNQVQVSPVRTTVDSPTRVPLSIAVRAEGAVTVTVTAPATIEPIGHARGKAQQQGSSRVELRRSASDPPLDAEPVIAVWSPPLPGVLPIHVVVRTADDVYSSGVGTLTVELAGANGLRFPIGGAPDLTAPATPDPLGLPIAETETETETASAETSSSPAGATDDPGDGRGMLTVVVAVLGLGVVGLALWDQRRRESRGDDP